MLRSARLLALTAIVTGLLPPAGAGASPTTPVGAEALRRSALRRVDATREAVRSGGLGQALRGGAALAGVRPDVPVPAVVPAPRGTPRALRATVARLLGALAAAQESARSARRIDPSEALATIRRSDTLRRRHAFGEAVPAALEALARRHADSIDRPVMYGGAIGFAEAIDRALPALRAYAGAAASTGRGAEAACDVLDAAPALCIGGEGPNLYTDDVWLQIDLGGDDVYRNAAGGGNVLPAASAVIDLAGNDLYERSAVSGAPAQGSALLGIGLLVDMTGDDRYVVRQAPGEGAESLVLAQAYAAFGVGAVLDGGGNDSFEASDIQPHSRVTVKAQGYAEFAALAVVLNRGGDDTYLVRAQPASLTTDDGRLYAGSAVAGGQGFALIGSAAIVSDDAGNDDIVVEALTSEIAPDEARIHQPADATAQGVGYATLGASAVVLSGPGATRRSVRAIASGNRGGWSQIDALAMGSFGGFAALDDPGGNDTYAMEGRSATVQRLDAQTCACAAATAASVVTYLAGEATAEAGSLALLSDRGGNDRYTSVAATTAEASMHDPRTEGASDIVSAEATAGLAANAAQAVGGAAGTAFLLDTAGDDVYDSTATSAAHAAATSASGGSELLTGSVSDEAYSTAQASGAVGAYGELRDQGGTDLYRSTNTSSATTEPPTGDGGISTYSSVQGSSIGGVPPYANETPAVALLLDIDGGAADTFEATPPDTACVGTRGKDAWVDCGMGAAGGLNA